MRSACQCRRGVGVAAVVAAAAPCGCVHWGVPHQAQLTTTSASTSASTTASTHHTDTATTTAGAVDADATAAATASHKGKKRRGGAGTGTGAVMELGHTTTTTAATTQASPRSTKPRPQRRRTRRRRSSSSSKIVGCGDAATQRGVGSTVPRRRRLVQSQGGAQTPRAPDKRALAAQPAASTARARSVLRTTATAAAEWCGRGCCGCAVVPRHRVVASQ